MNKKRYIIKLNAVEIVRLQQLVNNAPHYSYWKNILERLDELIKEIFDITKE